MSMASSAKDEARAAQEARLQGRLSLTPNKDKRGARDDDDAEVKKKKSKVLDTSEIVPQKRGVGSLTALPLCSLFCVPTLLVY